jgi:hypothetical protein
VIEILQLPWGPITLARPEFHAACTLGLVIYGYALLLDSRVDQALEAMVPNLQVFGMITRLRAPEKAGATQRRVRSELGARYS